MPRPHCLASRAQPPEGRGPPVQEPGSNLPPHLLFERILQMPKSPFLFKLTKWHPFAWSTKADRVGAMNR